MTGHPAVRLASIPLLLLLLGAAPAGAQIYAVPTRYCAGHLIGEQFITSVTPGPQGRADYSVTLFNPGTNQVEFRLQVTGDVIGRPTGLASLGAGQRTTARLGYSLNVPGRQPMRNEALAQAVLISCV